MGRTEKKVYGPEYKNTKIFGKNVPSKHNVLFIAVIVLLSFIVLSTIFQDNTKTYKDAIRSDFMKTMMNIRQSINKEYITNQYLGEKPQTELDSYLRVYLSQFTNVYNIEVENFYIQYVEQLITDEVSEGFFGASRYGILQSQYPITKILNVDDMMESVYRSTSIFDYNNIVKNELGVSIISQFLPFSIDTPNVTFILSLELDYDEFVNNQKQQQHVIKIYTLLIYGIIIMQIMLQFVFMRTKEYEVFMDQLLKYYQNNIYDIYWEINTQGKITSISNGILQNLGYYPKDVIGNNFNFWFTENEKTKLNGGLEKAFNKNIQIQRMINERYDSKGNVKYFETTMIPIFNATGKFEGYHCFDLNVTKYKYQKEKQKVFIEQFEKTPQPMIITDKNFKILKVNRQYLQKTGFTEADLVGKPAKVLSYGYHNPEYKDENLMKFNEELDNKESMVTTFTNITKNNQPIVFQQFITKLRRCDGSVSNYYAIYRNVNSNRENFISTNKQLCNIIFKHSTIPYIMFDQETGYILKYNSQQKEIFKEKLDEKYIFDIVVDSIEEIKVWIQNIVEKQILVKEEKEFLLDKHNTKKIPIYVQPTLLDDKEYIILLFNGEEHDPI